MSKFLKGIRNRFGKIDKDDLGKWGLMIGAGLLTLGSGIFDSRKKDRLYREKLAETIQEQTKRLMDRTNN